MYWLFNTLPSALSEGQSCFINAIPSDYLHPNSCLWTKTRVIFIVLPLTWHCLSLISLRRVNVKPICNPGLSSSTLIPTWTNEKASMDQMAGTSPLHVFLTGCPLAQCGNRTVLPKQTYVTLSHWPAPHAGMLLHPSYSWGHQRGGRQWGALLFLHVGNFLPV